MTSTHDNNISNSPEQQNGFDVSVIIVGWNTRKLLDDCLASLYAFTKKLNFEVIYVDNASADDSVHMVKTQYPKVRIIENPDNRGFVKANNQGIDVAQGSFVLLLNSDTILLNDAISETFAFASAHPDGAAFGCKVLNPDKSIQRSCFMFPSTLNFFLFSSYLYKIFPKNPFFGRQHMTWWDFNAEREVETISGCFSMVRRKAIDAVGKMDPLFFFYGDDLDWCFRFKKAGWKVYFCPQGNIIHYGGQSTKKMRRTFKLQLFGADLLFMRMHRGFFPFIATRVLVSQFFFLRFPFWLVKGLIKPRDRRDCFENALTYLIGSFLAFFDWKGLLMNKDYVVERFKNGLKSDIALLGP